MSMNRSCDITRMRFIGLCALFLTGRRGSAPCMRLDPMYAADIRTALHADTTISSSSSAPIRAMRNISRVSEDKYRPLPKREPFLGIEGAKCCKLLKIQQFRSEHGIVL